MSDKNKTPKPNPEGEGFWSKNYGNAKKPLAALKNNFFSKSAWRGERLVGTCFRTGGTVVGLGAALDGIFRAERKGDDGRPEERSGAGRIVETVLGLGLAAGSALHGGR